jgi:hypothetical protein
MASKPSRRILDFTFRIKDGVRISRLYGYTQLAISTNIVEDRSEHVLGRVLFEIHFSDRFGEGHKGSVVYSAPFSRFNVAVYVDGTSILNHILGSVSYSDLYEAKIVLAENPETTLMRVEDFRIELPLALKRAPWAGSHPAEVPSRSWWKRLTG